LLFLDNLEGVVINRRMFLIGTGCLGISTGLASAQVTTSESAKQTLSGKKLVPPANGTIKVACALSKEVTPIDWVGPQAVFGAWIYDETLKRDRPLFEVFTVGESQQPLDQWMIPDYTYEDAPQAQVIVVPGEADSPALSEWLKKVNKNADVTMSVCYGARQLAKIGLLDGQVATTHHDYIEPYAKEFPKIHWVSGVRFVEGPNVSTSAGVTAGIDLALHVYERYFGREKAMAVTRALEYQGTGWMV
jgi:transcriptional regulator GlxA family with amidase domain